MIREEEKNFLNGINTNKKEEKKNNGKHLTAQEKQMIFKNFMEILKIIILILATPFLLIIYFVVAICKYSK